MPGKGWRKNNMEKNFVNLVEEDAERLIDLIKYFKQFNSKPVNPFAASDFWQKVERITILLYGSLAAMLGLAFAIVVFKLTGMI